MIPHYASSTYICFPSVTTGKLSKRFGPRAKVNWTSSQGLVDQLEVNCYTACLAGMRKNQCQLPYHYALHRYSVDR